MYFRGVIDSSHNKKGIIQEQGIDVWVCTAYNNYYKDFISSGY